MTMRHSASPAIHVGGFKSRRHLAAGFTLLEMLVVLLITSLIFTLLMAALRQTLSVQERLDALGGDSVAEQLATDWLRGTIAGLQPDERLGPNVFHGETHQITGLTTQPVTVERSGMPTVIALRIESDRIKGQSVLQYDDGTTKLELLRRAADDMRFRFIGDDGQAQDAWPPIASDPPQIPRLILVEWGKGETAGELALSPQGPVLPRPGDIFGNGPGGNTPGGGLGGLSPVGGPGGLGPNNGR